MNRPWLHLYPFTAALEEAAIAAPSGLAHAGLINWSADHIGR